MIGLISIWHTCSTTSLFSSLKGIGAVFALLRHSTETGMRFIDRGALRPPVAFPGWLKVASNNIGYILNSHIILSGVIQSLSIKTCFSSQQQRWNQPSIGCLLQFRRNTHNLGVSVIYINWMTANGRQWNKIFKKKNENTQKIPRWQMCFLSSSPFIWAPTPTCRPTCHNPGLR